jgi:NADH-ubiquinone oxidoreductase chain 6
MGVTIHVGVIAILFLFTIMLINIRVSELVSSTANSLPLAFVFSAERWYYIMYNLVN